MKRIEPSAETSAAVRRAADIYLALEELGDAAQELSKERRTVERLLAACTKMRDAVQASGESGYGPAVVRLAPDTVLERSSFHEAGHAVAAAALNVRVLGVVLAGHPLAPSSHAGGVWSERPRNPSVDEARRYAAVALAGFHAEALHDHTVLVGGWATDFDDARNFLREAGVASISVEIDTAHGTAARIVAENWPAITRVALALLTRRHLSSAQLNELLVSETKAQRNHRKGPKRRR